MSPNQLEINGPICIILTTFKTLIDAKLFLETVFKQLITHGLTFVVYITWLDQISIYISNLIETFSVSSDSIDSVSSLWAKI